MKIIGITGGVGAGKTQILEYLNNKYGATICMADEVGKKLQKKGTECFDEIVAHFGEKILDEKIPKLTIQPLVENAIVHSVEVSKGKTVLNINGYIEQGNVVIEIKDDGVGMDRDTLLHLLDPPEGEEKDISVAHTGLGMYAVHQRLRYLYGEEYGLTADSEPGNGTCIKICIPFTKGEEKTWS